MEPDDLESAKRLCALVVQAGDDADTAEREAREERAGQREVEFALDALPHLDVEVLDAALGGVIGEAPQLRGLEVAFLDDEGEAVEAAPWVRLARQRVELPPQGVARAEVDLDGGAVRPPALPEVAPPAG